MFRRSFIQLRQQSLLSSLSGSVLCLVRYYMYFESLSAARVVQSCMLIQAIIGLPWFILCWILVVKILSSFATLIQDILWLCLCCLVHLGFPSGSLHKFGVKMDANSSLCLNNGPVHQTQLTSSVSIPAGHYVTFWRVRRCWLSWLISSHLWSISAPSWWSRLRTISYHHVFDAPISLSIDCLLYLECSWLNAYS